MTEEQRAADRARQKRYREKNKDRVRENQRRHRQSEKGKATARRAAKKWRASHPECHRRHALKKLYGLTVKEFEGMVAAQKGLCAICARPPRGKGTASRLHVDHCHVSGKIRGLLCTNCNALLGHAADSPLVLAAAIAYLQKGP